MLRVLAVGLCLALVLAWSHRRGAAVPAASAHSAVHATLPARTSPRSLVAAPPPRLRLRTTRHACRLSGLVTDAGAPVAAALHIYSRDQRTHELVAASNADADADGRFHVTLPPGDHFFYATHDGRSSEMIGPITLALSEELDDVDVELRGAGRVDGRVLNASGAPVDAELDLRASGEGYALEVDTSADDQGIFSLDPLPYGALEVTATDTGGGAQGSVRLAAPARGLVIELDGEGPALTVVVTDPDGDPLANEMVSAKDVSSQGPDVFVVNEITDADGRAVLHPSAARVSLTVTTWTNAFADPLLVDIDGDREVDIRLRRGAILRGRLLGSGDGSSRTMVCLVDEKIGSSEARVGGMFQQDDAFEWSGLPPGRYAVHAEPWRGSADHARKGAHAAERDDLTIAEVTLSDGQVLDLGDLSLPRLASVAGVVRNADGSPAPGATIELIIAASGREVMTTARSGDDGRFELDEVAEGVKVRAMGADASASDVVAVRGGELALTLRPLGFVEGVLHGLPPGPTAARCGGGIWQPAALDGSLQLLCTSDGIEVTAGGETRGYPIEITPGETSYFEIDW